MPLTVEDAVSGLSKDKKDILEFTNFYNYALSHATKIFIEACFDKDTKEPNPRCQSYLNCISQALKDASEHGTTLTKLKVYAKLNTELHGCNKLGQSPSDCDEGIEAAGKILLDTISKLAAEAPLYDRSIAYLTYHRIECIFALILMGFVLYFYPDVDSTPLVKKIQHDGFYDENMAFRKNPGIFTDGLSNAGSPICLEAQSGGMNIAHNCPSETPVILTPKGHVPAALEGGYGRNVIIKGVTPGHFFQGKNFSSPAIAKQVKARFTKACSSMVNQTLDPDRDRMPPLLSPELGRYTLTMSLYDAFKAGPSAFHTTSTSTMKASLTRAFKTLKTPAQIADYSEIMLGRRLDNTNMLDSLVDTSLKPVVPSRLALGSSGPSTPDDSAKPGGQVELTETQHVANLTTQLQTSLTNRDFLNFTSAATSYFALQEGYTKTIDTTLIQGYEQLKDGLDKTKIVDLAFEITEEAKRVGGISRVDICNRLQTVWKKKAADAGYTGDLDRLCIRKDRLDRLTDALRGALQDAAFAVGAGAGALTFKFTGHRRLEWGLWGLMMVSISHWALPLLSGLQTTTEALQYSAVISAVSAGGIGVAASYLTDNADEEGKGKKKKK